jgi:putative ABC transport system permease protein
LTVATRPPASVRLLALLRRLLLPRDLYADFVGEMNSALTDRYRAARKSSARTARAVVFSELRDLLSTAISERRTARGAPANASPHPQRPMPRGPGRTIRGAINVIDDFLNDLRLAIRALRRAPMVTAAAVLTLALGIGAVTAMFSVVNTVLLRPLPYEDSEDLVVVWTAFGPDLPQNWISGPEFTEIRDYNTTLDDFAVVNLDSAVLTGLDEPEQLRAAVVSGSLFPLLRVGAARGRVLGPEDDRPDAGNVVVISDGLWKRRFGADPEILGTAITLDDRQFTIVGVLPADFRFHHPNVADPAAVSLWLPLQPTYQIAYKELNRGSHFMLGVGRLREGATLARLRADLDSVAATMRETTEYYEFEGWGLSAYSLHADLVETNRGSLAILLGAVACVLLIGCVNVANLQLARASARERELAVRTALGAGRRRLLRQLMTENLVLASVGAVAGLGLASWFVRALLAAAPPGMPRLQEIGLDATALLFAVGATVLSAVLFGILPGLTAARTDPTGALREGGRGSSDGRAGRHARSALVVAEIALALVLAVGAGLMLRSFEGIVRADPGYDTESILTMRIPLPPRYDSAAARGFWAELLTQVRALPNVLDAGAISALPLSGTYSSGTTLVENSDRVPLVRDFQYPFIEADRRFVTTGYFAAMGVRLLRGRDFQEADSEEGALVAIVDEEFARRFWGEEDPIGRHVSIDFGTDSETEEFTVSWREVVGVVPHLKHYDLATIGREQIYIPIRQRPVTSAYLAVRTDGNPDALVPSIRQRLWEIDGNVPISNVRTMAERSVLSRAQPRFNSVLFSFFAVASLLLAAIGIYGVMSYSVGRRTNEIGVRMALGAGSGAVRRMILRSGAILVATGIGIGALLALGLARLLGSMLYGVSSRDPLTYAGVAVVLAGVALLASWIPAVRATRVDPATTLRDE